MQHIPIFVISLPHARERRIHVSAHLSRLGLSYTLVDGIDGTDLSAEERRTLVADGHDYHPGVIGCYLSHMSVYDRIVAQNIDLCLILEDDAVLNPSFAP